MAHPISSDLLALQQLLAGRYSIERELGRGGMGIVFLARDVALDRLVAIKLLPRALAEQAEYRDRFLHEARTAAGLSHPNIVPIHSVEDHGDLVFFVMAYVEGETLGQRVRARGPLVAREATRMIQEVAWALAYAHLRGMLGANVVPPARGAADTAPRATSDERLYVGPPFFARAPDAAGGADSSGPTVPSRWPLTVRSYRTRGLASGDSLERHAGLDLAVPVGSDVRASGGGLVGQTGSDSAYGLFVMLRHPDGYETMYGHLSRVLVQRGDRVREGQVIALTGNSGRSTAPHLHFEVRRGGRSVNPLSLVREGN